MTIDDPSDSFHGEAVVQPSPIRDGGWTDDDGRHWTHRGSGRKAAKRFERLARSPEVRMVHVDGPGKPRDVDESERAQFWSRVRPYLAHPGGQNPDGMDAFDVAEFKDREGNSLLMIEEDC